MRHFDRRVPEEQRNLSETSTWLSKILSQKRIVGGGIATLILIAGLSTYFSEEIKGATYGWTQSNWSGGQTANKANHTNNQENWTEYASKDSNIQADANGVTISGTSNSWIQTSDSDFNAGTNDGIVVSGGGCFFSSSSWSKLYELYPMYELFLYWESLWIGQWLWHSSGRRRESLRIDRYWNSVLAQ